MSGRQIGLFALTLTVALVTVVSLTRAQMEVGEARLIPYQGRLELDGIAVSGPHDFRFALFASEAADASCLVLDTPSSCGVWWEEQDGVGVYSGAFSVELGTTAALEDPVFAQTELYLAIAVRTSGTPAFTLLSSKKRVLPLPFAARAAAARSFSVSEDLFVGGGATVDGDVSVGGGLTTGGGLTVGGAAAVTGDLSTSARLSSGTHMFDYQAWDGTNNIGDGGATICNDNTPSGHRKLMILGNNSAGGNRRVGLWDDVYVYGSLSLAGSRDLLLRVDGDTVTSGGNKTPEVYQMTGAGSPICTRGKMFVGRPSGSGGQDALCVCLNVSGDLEWWCFNP